MGFIFFLGSIKHFLKKKISCLGWGKYLAKQNSAPFFPLVGMVC